MPSFDFSDLTAPVKDSKSAPPPNKLDFSDLTIPKSGSIDDNVSSAVGGFLKDVGNKVAAIPGAVAQIPHMVKGAYDEYIKDPNGLNPLQSEAGLTAAGKAVDVALPGSRHVGAAVEHAVTGEDTDKILQKYKNREVQNPNSAAVGSVAGQVGQGAALTAAMGPAGALLAIPAGDASQQFSDTGKVDPKTLAENTAAGLVIPGALKAVEETGPVLNAVTRKLAPAASQEAVNTFTRDSKAFTRAKQNAILAPKLEGDVTQAAQTAEGTLDSALKAKKQQSDALYEAARQKAKESTKQVENPSTATSEQIRMKLEGAATDKDLAPVQNALNKAVDEIGIPRDGVTKSPRQLQTPENGTVPTVQYEPFTDGENMNMSIGLRKRVDDMIANLDGPFASSADKTAKIKLQGLRDEINHKIRSAEDFDPEAHQLQGQADKEFAVAEKGRQVVNPELSKSRVNIEGDTVHLPNAGMIKTAAASTSPLDSALTKQGLTNLEVPDLLDPVQAAQKAVADQQHLVNLKQTMRGTGPLSHVLPNVGTAVTVGNGLTAAGKAIAGSRLVQGIQQTLRAKQDQTNVANDQKTQVIQSFKQNPSAAGWLSVKARGLAPTVTRQELRSASGLYGVPEAQLQDALIKLGKQVEP